MGTIRASEIDGLATAGRFEGTLSLRGVARPIALSLTIDRQRATLAVRASFNLNLESFGVALPAVGLLPVDKHVEVTFAARLHAHPGAVVSGGSIRAQRSARLW